MTKGPGESHASAEPRALHFFHEQAAWGQKELPIGGWSCLTGAPGARCLTCAFLLLVCSAAADLHPMVTPPSMAAVHQGPKQQDGGRT